MRSYEVTYIVDSTLENDKIKSTAKQYQDMLTKNGATIVAVNEIGLRQLAYPIKRRNSGIYYCVEFQTPTPDVIGTTELAMRRDDSILRFLTVSLNKFGVKYNADKREGKIGVARKIVKEEIKDERDNRRGRKNRNDRNKKAAPAKPAAAPKAEPVAAAAPAAPVAEPVKVAAPAPAAPVAEPAKAAPAPVAAPAPAAKDDLKKIEGIGPKIAEILNAGNINTFAELAASTPEAIRALLTAAGGRFAAHNPQTWPMQSGMAAEGKWDELKKWQDESDGGKPIAKSEEE